MRLINLTRFYFYKPIKVKKDGEFSTRWEYVSSYLLNAQQDVNELDKNLAGYVDFEILKLRTDKRLELSKNYGVSFCKLEEDDEGYTTTPPEYTITGYLKVGRCTTYTLNTYHGE